MSLDSIRVIKNEEHTVCIFGRQLAVCTSLTRPDINFVEGQYQSNPSLDHWKAAKKVVRYLQGTTNYRSTYMHINQLEVIGYLESLPEDIYIYIYILEVIYLREVLNKQLLLHLPQRLLNTMKLNTCNMVKEFYHSSQDFRY